MSRSNPLPVSLQQECRKASKIFSSFVDPVNGLDNIIPPSILRKAKGFAFLTIVKAGFVFSARAGTGCVIARLPDGTFSAPSAIGTTAVGFGFQAGAELTEFMIILNSSAAVKSFMTKGSLAIGGNMSVAAGPFGRNLEGSGTLSAKGGVAAMYSYSRSKGLFGGASIEGSIIVERSDANSKAYGFNVTAKQLLSGNFTDDLPRWAQELGETIKTRSGKDNRIPGWIEDGDEIEQDQDQDEEDDDERGNYSDDSQGGGGGRRRKREIFRDDGLTPKEHAERGYSFGSQYASGGSHQSQQLASPNRSRSGSTASKLGGILGGGRIRSGSGPTADDNNNSNKGGPLAGDGPNFATKFTSDINNHDDRSTSSPLRKRGSISLIDAQDPFSDLDQQTTTTTRPSLFSRMSSSSINNNKSKLTKSNNKTLSNNNNGLRERVGQMNWSTFDNDLDARDSFSSIEDDSHSRKRASTITDTLSSYHRPPLSSSNSNSNSTKGGGRSRSFTSPFGGGGSSSSSPFSLGKKKPKPEFTAYNNDNNAQQDDDDGEYEFDEPEYNNNNSNRNKQKQNNNKDSTNPQPQPWDSEDETFIKSSLKPVRPSPSLAQSHRTGRDAFDFSQVEADFENVQDGKGLRNRSGTLTPTTASTSSKGAIGTAIAKYDFKGVESTDLPFFKGDVLVILDKEDEEWWRARLKLREGMIPRNYIVADEWDLSKLN